MLRRQVANRSQLVAEDCFHRVARIASEQGA
jgi:hypothetical protein